MGILSGALAIAPKILLAQHKIRGMEEILRLSGFANDSLARLVVLLFICIPIGTHSLLLSCDSARGNQRSSVSILVRFKFIFTAVTLGEE